MRTVTLDVQGEQLSLGVHDPVGTPKAGLVLLHGFQSCRRELGSAPDELAKRGYAVAAVDFRGHGESGGPSGVMTRVRAIEDARAAAVFLTRETPGLPIGLVGHSLGGSMAVAALPHVPEFQAAAIVAPADDLIGETHPVERWLYLRALEMSNWLVARGRSPIVMPYRHATNYGVLFADKAVARAAKREAFLLKSVSLAEGNDLVAVKASEWARAVTTPVMTVIATRDEVVKNASSLRVHDNLAGEKELVEIDSGHSAFRDRAREELLDVLDGWFSRRLVQAATETGARRG